MNDILLREISEIQVAELRQGLNDLLSDMNVTTTYDGGGTWVLGGPGAVRTPEGEFDFVVGSWELKESSSTIVPLNAEAFAFLEILVTRQKILPTPVPTQVPTPNPTPSTKQAQGEELLSFVLSTCIASLEQEHGGTLFTSFDSEHLFDNEWRISAKNELLGLDYGTWTVYPLVGNAEPLDSAANQTQGILTSSSGVCSLSKFAPR